ncbi:hypothetical protein ACOME3_002871 [Neoechinorhynchus agilis]
MESSSGEPGSLISYILKRPKQDIIAICLETGIQNTGIAIYILTQALEQPFASLSLICPIFVALATPIPIVTCLSIRMILERVRNRKTAKNQDKHEEMSDGPVVIVQPLVI